MAPSDPTRLNRRNVLRLAVPAALGLAGGATLGGTGANAADLEAALGRRITEFLASTGTEVEASVAVSRGSRRLFFNNAQVHDTASIVKMEILAMLQEHYGSAAAIPATRKELARRMITESHNNSATELYNFLGGCDALAAAHRRYGLTNTNSSADCRWGLTTTVASDQLALAGINLFTGRLTLEQVRYGRQLMGSVVGSQRWGISSAAKSGETVWLKNGWDTRTSLGGLWVLNSVGVIAVPGGSAIRMAILTSKATGTAEGIPIVERIARIARSVVSQVN